MPLSHLIELEKELALAMTERDHPFRLFTLATQGVNLSPDLRTVVLRDVLPDHHLIFYTDERSQKVSQIRANNRISALFYHPSIFLQVKFSGYAHIIRDLHRLEQQWKAVPEQNKKDYTSTLRPGQTVASPEVLANAHGEPHFCAIEIEPKTIEYLKIGRDYHTKVRFEKKEGDWHGTFLVP